MKMHPPLKQPPAIGENPQPLELANFILWQLLQMDVIDVPEIKQLPELSGEEENPGAFVDMVLTTFLRCDCAFLYAEYESGDSVESPVSWRIHPQIEGVVSREFEAGLSPSLSSFDASLKYVSQRYFREASRHGVAERILKQQGVMRRCLLFMPGTERAGRWIRAYLFPK